MTSSPTTELLRSSEALRVRGSYVDAERHAREAIALLESADPHDHGLLAIALNSLGLACKDLAKFDDARAAYERALELLRVSGASEDSIATIYHNLGGIEHARGSYAAAETFARTGLAVRRRVSADSDLVAGDMVALAAILDGLDQHEEAEALYREGLQVFQRDRVTNAGEIAVALHGLGTLCSVRGRLQEAESYLTEAAAIKTDLLGSRHVDVAVTLNNLAFVYRRLGNPERAGATYLLALEIFTDALGESHPKTIACRENSRIVSGTRPE